MSYTARQLITESYYLSGINSRQFQVLCGDQLSDGLNMLKDLIADKAFDKRFIPYFSEYDFTATIGQEKYFIPNLVEIETFTFNIGDVRFGTYNVGRKNYFGTSRVDNVESLPFKWHVERCMGGSNLYLYFLPADEYPLKIWGKFAPSDVITENTNLATVFERYFLHYLKYELAAYVCNFYNVPMQAQNADTLEALRNKIRDQSPIDLTQVRRIRYSSNFYPNWADVNIGNGWRPPS